MRASRYAVKPDASSFAPPLGSRRRLAQGASRERRRSPHLPTEGVSLLRTGALERAMPGPSVSQPVSTNERECRVQVARVIERRT